MLVGQTTGIDGESRLEAVDGSTGHVGKDRAGVAQPLYLAGFAAGTVYQIVMDTWSNR